MIKRIIYDLFNIIPPIIPRPLLYMHNRKMHYLQINNMEIDIYIETWSCHINYVLLVMCKEAVDCGFPKIIKLILAHCVNNKDKYYLTRSQNNSFIAWHSSHEVFHDNSYNYYTTGSLLLVKIN
jgi:hypothetical protein